MAGQIHPLGARYSANWYAVALANWRRIHRLPRDPGYGYAGRSLSVHPLHGLVAFVVDQRGTGGGRFRAEFPFCSRPERRRAFAMALRLMDALP